MDIVKKIPTINKDELLRISKLKREEICLEIREKLLYLEKYSTTEDNNKITYMMIPYNHPNYEFPYNLEDRLKYIIEKIIIILKQKIIFKTLKQKDKNTNIFYILTFKNEKIISDFKDDILKIGFALKDDIWSYDIK